VKKMFRVVEREYLERVKKKSFLISTILGPVLMGLLIFAPALLLKLSPETQTSIAVIDMTGKIYGQMKSSLSDSLPDGTPRFRLREVRSAGPKLEETRRELNLEIENDALDGYVVIPAQVADSSRAVFYGKRIGDIKTLERLESALSNIVVGMRLSERGLDYGVVSELTKGVDLETKQITGKGEEKNNRVIEVLLSSLRAQDLLFGKIFGVGAVGLTQYAIWGIFGTLMTVYGLTMGGQVAEIAGNLSLSTLAFFILYYILGFLFYSTLFAGIGAVCNTDQEAQQMQMPVVLCLVFTILIPMMVIQRPDSAFATIISLIPMFTPIVMFMRINVMTPPAWQIALSVAIMILSIIVAGKLSAKIFRTGILMYGKKPDAREILKWLRRA
jgi:ABC-2 type transport system permease protein